MVEVISRCTKPGFSAAAIGIVVFNIHPCFYRLRDAICAKDVLLACVASTSSQRLVLRNRAVLAEGLELELAIGLCRMRTVEGIGCQSATVASAVLIRSIVRC